MIKSNFIEDIFVEFSSLLFLNYTAVSPQEFSAATDFHNLFSNNKQITQNQANFVLKLLNKYRVFMSQHGLDYTAQLNNPQWKNSFRVIDMSKRVSVERDTDGELWIHLKFPFTLKEVFEKEVTPVIKNFSNSRWDADKKVRIIKLYDYNVVEVSNFVEKHNFDVDATFLDVLANVEQIWQNQDQALPYSVIIDNKVHIVNSSTDTDEYWNSHTNSNQNANLLLAKAMGYPLRIDHANPSKLEVISSSAHSHFWIKEVPDFFEIQKLVNGTVAVMLNRGDNYFEWLKEFIKGADAAGIPRCDIRVCFRMDKNEDKGFNQWVKDQGLGGKVEGGKIFIFQNKPPKWLFSDSVNVTIIATNSLYPVPSSITQSWMSTHPCVCYLGPIKAVNARERKIVEL